MANIKKLQKSLVKLNEEELKEVLEFLTDEDEEVVEEETKVEVKEETKKTEEKVEEPKPQFATIDDIKGLLEQFKDQFVVKEELEEVKKTKKSAFGVDTSKEKPNDDSQSGKTAQDYLAKIKAQGF